MNDMMIQVKTDASAYRANLYKNQHEKREDLIVFTFPEWTREEYLAFAAEWKERYANHSAMSREAKRDRKATEGATNYEVWVLRHGARRLLAMRKASKKWAGELRARALRPAA